MRTMWELVSGSGKRNIMHVEWVWSIYHSLAGGGKANYEPIDAL